MADNKPNRLWSILILVLIIVIIISTVIGLSRYQPAHTIEISLPLEQEFKGNIQIGGAVTNPGIYPFSNNDSLDSLLQAAGGATTNADADMLQLIVPEKSAQSHGYWKHCRELALPGLRQLSPTASNTDFSNIQAN
jgi:DNA uptake protein ComE-like DNA-binding protein